MSVGALSHSVSDLPSQMVIIPCTAVLDVRKWVSSQITGAFLRLRQLLSFFSFLVTNDGTTTASFGVFRRDKFLAAGSTFNMDVEARHLQVSVLLRLRIPIPVTFHPHYVAESSLGVF